MYPLEKKVYVPCTYNGVLKELYQSIFFWVQLYQSFNDFKQAHAFFLFSNSKFYF